MKGFKLFSIVALALFLGSCNDIMQQPKEEGIYFVATIGPAYGTPMTRTVISEGTGSDEGKLTVAWKGGEEIALVHNGTWDKVTVTTVNPDGTAVVSGTISPLGAEGEAAKLVYPYAGVKGVSSGTIYIPNSDDEFLAPGYAQDGTLDYIGNNDLDGRVGDGILKTVGGNITIKESDSEDNVEMKSKTAIWKLTLLDGTATTINAKTVSLALGGKCIAAGAYASGKSTYYLCVVPTAMTAIYALMPSAVFTISANDGTKTYTYTCYSTVSLMNGKYYESIVKLSE